MPKRHHITILGSDVSYWVSNPDKKRTIVMVHGFRGTHEGLDEITDRLNDFRVIVPDLPGFGHSTPFESDKPHSIDNYVSFLSVFMKQLNLSKPTLLGHSFGSIIAAHFAAKNQSAINKLILINPINAPALKGPKAAMTKLAILYYWLGKKLPTGVSKVLLSNKGIVLIMSVTMAKTKDKVLRQKIHTNHFTHFSRFANPQVVDEAFKASVSHTAREVAHGLTMPTLLIAGDKDDITSLKMQQEATKDYPHGQLVVIKNVGHLIHYEKPDEAVSAITTFLG